MIGIYTFDCFDRGKLTVEVDWDHPEAEKTCKEINDFWSGSEDRLGECPETEDEVTGRDRLGYAASKLILDALIGVADRRTVMTTKWARAYFNSPWAEGFPELNGEYGIRIKTWEWIPVDVDDFYCDWARVDKQ